MKVDADEKWNVVLKDLRKGYLKHLPEKLAEAKNIWNLLIQTWSEDKFLKFFRLVHGVAGTSATYKFVEISHKARQLESFLQEIKVKNELKNSPCKEKKDEIDRLLNILIVTAHVSDKH